MVGGVDHAADQERAQRPGQHFVRVQQHAHAHASEMRDPDVGAGVAVVVAEHEVCFALARQLGERRHVGGEAGDRAVDDVARQRDEVGLERQSLSTTRCT